MKFRARFIANVIQFAVQQGASRKELLKHTGKTMEELSDEYLFLESGIYNRVLEKAVELTDDPFFGLHLGDYMSLSAAGLIVQIVQSSRTVREAIDFMVEFANLGCQAMPFQLEQVGGRYELTLNPHPIWQEQSPLAVRHTIDGMLIFTLREFHTLTRYRHYPVAIKLNDLRPRQFAVYEQLFQCPVLFDQDSTAMVLDERHLDEAVITSDFNLLQHLVKYAHEKLTTFEGTSGFSTVVRQAIVNMLKPQFPTIEQVAGNLNISVRTLQRRLKEEELTYKSLLDEIRQQFATDYLQNPNLSIKEVAYLLDYADASSFVRSFKRWKGISPNAFREMHG